MYITTYPELEILQYNVSMIRGRNKSDISWWLKYKNVPPTK